MYVYGHRVQQMNYIIGKVAIPSNKTATRNKEQGSYLV